MTDLDNYLNDLDEYKARVCALGIIPDHILDASQLELQAFHLKLEALRLKIQEMGTVMNEPPVS